MKGLNSFLTHFYLFLIYFSSKSPLQLRHSCHQCKYTQNTINASMHTISALAHTQVQYQCQHGTNVTTLRTSPTLTRKAHHFKMILRGCLLLKRFVLLVQRFYSQGHRKLSWKKNKSIKKTCLLCTTRLFSIVL